MTIQSNHCCYTGFERKKWCQQHAAILRCCKKRNFVFFCSRANKGSTLLCGLPLQLKLAVIQTNILPSITVNSFSFTGLLQG